MRTPLWDRFAFWLEQFAVLRPVLLRHDGPAPIGQRYINRLNGHVVVVTEAGELR